MRIEGSGKLMHWVRKSQSGTECAFDEIGPEEVERPAHVRILVRVHSIVG